jgi:hypothetical protein
MPPAMTATKQVTVNAAKHKVRNIHNSCAQQTLSITVGHRTRQRLALEAADKNIIIKPPLGGDQ